MKECCVCKKEFDYEMFHKNKSRKDGLSETCKMCARERASIWRKNNTDRANKTNAEWRSKNASHLKEYYSDWYKNGGDEKVKSNTAKSRINNPETHKAYGRKTMSKLRECPEFKAKERLATKQRKAAIISHYSNNQNKCACCGESHIEFLTVDHIDGGGNKHRAEIKNFYLWIIRNKFPSGFRILCMNCNFSFGKYGYCPHHNINS